MDQRDEKQTQQSSWPRRNPSFIKYRFFISNSTSQDTNFSLTKSRLIHGLDSLENANTLEFADSLGRKVPNDAILKDVLMIENQIPFLVLKHLLTEKLSKTKFCSTRFGNIVFVKQDATLRLAVLTLNVNSEVIIRNLMLYETILVPGTPDFALYNELMAAMIHTVDDVELLNNKKILMHDGDNDEVVKFFSGIKSCIPSEGESAFDCSIKDLSEYYGNQWKIRSRKLMEKYVQSSWKVLTVLAIILLLLFIALQTFCSIYNCHCTLR
ncbi:hypothetical protein RCOM_0810710 [Ricinus communis]|uniref:Uncharacterized protein n=1 Tax=Ricinus communis TaxID=3988 RepID=B9RY67_RICCO|nr:hypothetical protein RCOM_0810710 [Ricinus communis]